MLEATKEQLREAIEADAGAVGLFLSGGPSSTLLLYMLLDLKARFHPVCLDNTFTRDQRRQIDALLIKHNLRVLGYAPSNAYLVGDGEKKVSLVEEYQFPDGSQMPVIRDAVHVASRCSLVDVMVGPFHSGPAPVGFTLNIFGGRRFDRHYATGRRYRQRSWRSDLQTYLMPLWDWTKKDVRKALKHYGVSYPKLNASSIPMCLNCLTGKGQVHCPKLDKEIDAIEWDPVLMRTEFQKKYALI